MCGCPDDNYEIIADFWGAGINQTQFVNEIQQKYAHQMLLHTAATQGYSIEAEEVMEDGTVRVVVGRWIYSTFRIHEVRLTIAESAFQEHLCTPRNWRVL